MLKIGINFWMKLLSLPSWERGLKFYRFCPKTSSLPSLPSWERGLKYILANNISHPIDVAPLVGAWIEMSPVASTFHFKRSLPSWERGLKLLMIFSIASLFVSLPSWERGLK